MSQKLAALELSRSDPSVSVKTVELKSLDLKFDKLQKLEVLIIP